MGRLFLYGDVARNFPSESVHFTAAAGGRSARIALLLMGGPTVKKYLPYYREPLREQGAKVITIMPGKDGRLPSDAEEKLRRCTGILMGGGKTPRYQSLYVQSHLGPVIRELWQSGIPYGGISAGALLVSEICTLSGKRVTTHTNQYWVRPPGERGDGSELVLGQGLGLLRDWTFEVHLAEFGSLPRLLAAMGKAGTTRGLGIDEPICAELIEGTTLRIHGQGRAYLVRRFGSGEFALQILEPGDSLKL